MKEHTNSVCIKDTHWKSGKIHNARIKHTAKEDADTMEQVTDISADTSRRVITLHRGPVSTMKLAALKITISRFWNSLEKNAQDFYSFKPSFDHYRT